MFSAADYDLEEVDVWPENWKAWTLFCRVSTQWRIVSGLAGAGYTGLDYPAVYPLLDQIAIDKQEWMELFEDVQVLESAALARISENDKD